MRILRITLRNLASLAGTHTVDFTRDPLRTAGLFSISGPTGSGKSTLLDALCLALYDETPRLRGIGRLAELGSGERQSDRRNLLRRGAGEGYAEVAFAGVDGQVFTARWLVRRARGRADGSLQNTEMTLFRGDVRAGAEAAIEQGGRKTEVLPVIAEKVGLTFEQFTRAVLLAQNDFATFLKAADHERAEILQALTGTARFEAISIAVFERCAGMQREVADLELRLAGQAPLPPEARAEAESTAARLEAERQQAAEKVTGREGHAAWFVRGKELSQNVEAAERELATTRKVQDAAAPRRRDLQHTEQAGREARALWDTERRTATELAAAEETCRRATQTEAAARDHADTAKRLHDESAAALTAATAACDTARPALRQARQLDAQLAPLAERLATAIRERETAEGQVRSAVARRDELLRARDVAEKERTLLAAKQAALAALAPFAPEVTAWLDRLDRATTARLALDEAGKILAAKTQQERDKEAVAATERASEAEARRALAAATDVFEKAEAAARAQDGEQIAATRRATERTRSALHGLSEHLRREDLRAEVATLKADQEAEARALAELSEVRIPAAKQALEAARRSSELAQAAVTDAATALRETLAPAAPCPVCGALDHPYASHPPSSETAALRALRDDCAAKEKGCDGLRERAARLGAAGEARLKRVSEVQRAIDSLAATPEPGAEEPAVATILALPASERAAALQARQAVEAESLTALDRADAARREAEKHRDACRKRRDAAVEELAKWESKVRTLAEEIAGLRAAREAAGETRDRTERASRASLDELNPLFTGLPGSRAAWELDSPAFRKRFTNDARQWSDGEKKAVELETVIAKNTAALLPLMEGVAAAELVRKTRHEEEAVARGVHESLRAQRATIFGGRAADAVESEVNAALRTATQTREICAEKVAEAGKQLAASAEMLKAANQAFTDAIDRRNAAAAALDAWLASFAPEAGPPLDRPALEKILARDDAWIRAERAALDALDGAIRTADGVLADRQKTLAAHLAGRPTQDDESAVAADLALLREARLQAEHRRDTARAHLLADDQRLRDNATLAAQLGQGRTAAEPWIKLNELIGSADGAKFRGIAQRRTLDILLGYANAQLELLAARYRLERLPESLNLIVVDRDMGDERRSVHSLSGGESFLVSLALALALASLTSNRLRIESLFIDEGFGSLDPETLNTAMNALMHLEAQGRKVGVISHVSEMADAIPVQIRVVKGRSGASRLIVPGAAAAESEYEAVVDENGGTAAEAEAVSARIVEILMREKAAGKMKVSTRAMREEIGCELSLLTAARMLLAGQVIAEGKSLVLADASPS